MRNGRLRIGDVLVSHGREIVVYAKRMHGMTGKIEPLLCWIPRTGEGVGPSFSHGDCRSSRVNVVRIDFAAAASVLKRIAIADMNNAKRSRLKRVKKIYTDLAKKNSVRAERIARIGNSVPPPVVAAIVRANCGEQREAVSA